MISTRGATDVGQARFCAVRHEFRLELTDGGDVFWELAHPSLLLTRMVEECPSLQEVFAAAFRRREPTAEERGDADAVQPLQQMMVATCEP